VTLARQALGLDGEQRARRVLEARGYRMLDCRYRTRHGEIDLVARHDAVVVFVEVKARRGRRFGDPAASVTPQKQRRLVAMAIEYLARHRLGRAAVRFDVVTVDHTAGADPLVTVIPGAFRPGW
jgi:putative endonuclease